MQSAQLEKLALFNRRWDEQIAQLSRQGQELEADLGDRHRAEAEQLQQSFVASQSPPKPNPELLNLIEMRKKMVKTRRYADADMASQRIEEIQSRLNQEWRQKEKMKLDSLLVNLEKKHAMELQGLRIRIDNGIKENEKERAKELDNLLQKYQNFQRELENKNTFDLQKYQKVLQKQNEMIIAESSNLSTSDL
eukprot:TRINITY_DN4603_c0_g1_i3.p2 TRINITY_DN4603_c0_g1~~TRINITY_DN4603_c0_g1_i3.p2  ORF type:complete len:193 (-),score=87.46 TRINITY_DN4603_c0_g1_i3:96-674(-)